MNEIKVPIPARLKNIAVGGHVTGTEDIIDDNLNKTQNIINEEIDNRVATLEESVGPGGTVDERIEIERRRAIQAETVEKNRAESAEKDLSNRLSDVEQLSEISLDGGEAQIASSEDFHNPTAE
jgi:hypothetical protein